MFADSEHSSEDGRGRLEVPGDFGGDDLETPKSEVPIALQVVREGEDARQHEETAGRDYFTTALASTESTGLTITKTTAVPTQSPVVTGSNVTASGEIVLPVPEHPLYLANHPTESNESIATVTTVHAPRPAFPNQSYAALHHQHYPPPHLPPTLRARSSHPGQIFTFASALASSHQQGSRTAGNSPAVTPGLGLFSPSSQPTPQNDYPETPGTYASPFLHFTHRQVPKETHVADVDVDPISGRKLINHYEIIDELGRGTHGKVKLGRDLQTEDTHVAIKIVERYSKRRKLGKLGQAEDKVKKEVAILKKARHPNIVALLEVIDDPSRKKVYIVLEWVARGEIHWRTKTRKEIALVEARRYERERKGRQNALTEAEDNAVMTEAKKRLARYRRHELRTYRQERRDASELPDYMWSAELIGDNESDQSEDDHLSRVSTATSESASGRVVAEETRLPSRAASPFHTLKEKERSKDAPPTALDTSETVHFLPLTKESERMSPTAYEKTHSMFSRNGLEGTMYGPYDPSSTESSRHSSIHGSVDSLPGIDTTTPEGLAQLASEVLDSDLNPELEYVPVMTLQQARVAFRDTLLGLQYLHYQGIVHRDIKPPNLLSTIDHRVKISDFGVSYLGRPLHDGDPGEEVSEHEAQDFDEAKELAKTVGTPAFYAPELCITDPGDDPLPVTKAIDVWALGITLFCMLFARTPFVDSEFIVMRQIADEEIYIPRKRLLPVQLETKSRSRPNSHSRVFPGLPAGRRNEFNFAHEEIDDELYDLLRSLLDKDPRKRITLEDVRRHPWVLHDLPNQVKWLEETDASRQSQGKKIEVSNEELNTAVVPLQFLDRVRSGIKKVGERLGFSASSKPPSRGRAHSSAGKSTGGSPGPSPHSSSSTISQDARKQSLRGDESIFSALQKSREAEHPLSRSVLPSPKLERSSYLAESTALLVPELVEEEEEDTFRPTLSRPNPPERSRTIMSTTGSARTVKASDYQDSNPPPSPGLPGTPVALESYGAQGLSTILGSGSARRVLKSLRERSSHQSLHLRRHISHDSGDESTDQHAGPSLAVSQTLASGLVNLPDALKDLLPSLSEPGSLSGSVRSSARNSPAPSAPASLVSSPSNYLYPTTVESGRLSRQSSGSSIKSISRLAAEYMRSPNASRPQSRTAPESSRENWQRAEEEMVRKLVRERTEKDRILEQSAKKHEGSTCPPSPDDQRAARRQSRRISNLDISNPVSSHETSPTSHSTFLPPAMASSTSDFGSAVSMSISNPSIPSVISEASSTDPNDGMSMEEYYFDNKGRGSSDGTANPPARLREEEVVDDGYSPDHEPPFDSDNEDEYDSSSDSDGGLVMTRRKSIAQTAKPPIGNGNGSLATALDAAAGLKERRGTGLSTRSKKSSRSGSNNTMKKVRTRDSIQD